MGVIKVKAYTTSAGRRVNAHLRLKDLEKRVSRSVFRADRARKPHIAAQRINLISKLAKRRKELRLIAKTNRQLSKALTVTDREKVLKNMTRTMRKLGI